MSNTITIGRLTFTSPGELSFSGSTNQVNNSVSISGKLAVDDLVLPSKLLGILAAGKPVIGIAPKDSELGKKLETRLNSKVNETVIQAGIGEDLVTPSVTPSFGGASIRKKSRQDLKDRGTARRLGELRSTIDATGNIRPPSITDQMSSLDFSPGN